MSDKVVETGEKESTKYWRDRDLGNLELLRATFVTHAFSRHVHDEFAIGVIERGAEQFEYRRAQHIAPTGSIVMINPGEPHTGQAVTQGGWTYRMLYPEPGLLQEAASQMAGRRQGMPFFREPVVRDEQLGQMMLKLHHDLETASTKLERESRLLVVLTQLVARYAEDRPVLAGIGREDRSVRQVRDYLETHYAENPMLEELARVANLSPFHLLRVFRQQFGLPPHAYLNQLRIGQAKTLLTQGYSISEVALETGFVDQSHLTRQFKRIVGVTPGQYLRTEE